MKRETQLAAAFCRANLKIAGLPRVLHLHIAKCLILVASVGVSQLAAAKLHCTASHASTAQETVHARAAAERSTARREGVRVQGNAGSIQGLRVRAAAMPGNVIVV